MAPSERKGSAPEGAWLETHRDKRLRQPFSQPKSIRIPLQEEGISAYVHMENSNFFDPVVDKNTLLLISVTKIGTIFKSKIVSLCLCF